MVEKELDGISNKLKTDDFDINIMEKNILKLEKKIIKLNNKINEINNKQEDSCSEESCDSNSDCNIDIDDILKDLDILENKLNNNLKDNNIETLIDIYNDFKNKLNKIKIKNNDFKLSIEYLT